MVTFASTEASAAYDKYSKTYQKWLKTAYPDKYGNLINRTPIRRGAKKLGQLYFLYEGLKEVFSTGDIPTDLGERENYRVNTITQHEKNIIPTVKYENGMAVGFEPAKGSDVDMSQFVPYTALSAPQHTIPETDDGEQLEWIDPMDEWWPAHENVYDKAREPWNLLPTAGKAIKGMYESAKHVTPPPIRDQIGTITRGMTDVLKWGWNPKKYPLGDDDPNKEGYQ